MGLFLEKKWPRLILAAYLAFAVMGIFTFAATESLRSVDFWENVSASGVFVTQQDLIAESPVEGEPVIGKARGHLFSPLRNGSLRIVMPLGTRDTGSVLAQSSLRAIEKVNHLTIKNAILLKLRI
jgi:hypothetical protein